jgi:glycosyltransferase involved in cell wall biosynthesis
MRIAYCWMGYSSYMASCWRALNAYEDVDLHIISCMFKNPGFKDNLIADLPHTRTTPQDLSLDALTSFLDDFQPDIMIVSGWKLPVYQRVVKAKKYAHIIKILAMDNPWEGSIRQYFGRLRHRNYFRRFKYISTPGERAAILAQVLGFSRQQNIPILYSVDDRNLTPIFERRMEDSYQWPKRFLYIGRYEHVKALDILTEAYSRYRSRVDSPWPLTCTGGGSLDHLLEDVEGIQNVGFTQPAELPELMLQHGVFVIASRYEPWGLVLPETACSGMPIVSSDACGPVTELIRPLYNGMIFPSEDIDALTDALVWIHDHYEDLPEMGRQSHLYALPFTATNWAKHWHYRFAQMMNSKHS